MKINHYVLLAGLLFPVSEAVQAQQLTHSPGQVEKSQLAADKAKADYPINYAWDTKSSSNNRSLRNIHLKSVNDKEQAIAVNQSKTGLLYLNELDKAFGARQGLNVAPRFDWQGSWMNGYIYIDVDNDGQFDVETRVETQGDQKVTILVNPKDLMSYSHFSGKNSNGDDLQGGEIAEVNPPAFRLPKSVGPGVYRMRYKVDWNNVDPGGSTDKGNEITTNSGAIVDTRLIVHNGWSNYSTGTRPDGGGLHGTLLKENGTPLTASKIRYGNPLSIQVKADENYVFSHLVLRHGVGIAGGDSLVHGTPQYVETVVPSYLFEGNRYTIPGEYMQTEVLIVPYFVKEETAGGEDYALNFDKKLTVKSEGVSFSGLKVKATQGQESRISSSTQYGNTVYRDLTKKEISVVPGDEVNTEINYVGKGMNAYLYIDYNQDGFFNASLRADGTPDVVSEVVSFSYYQGKNSLGQSLSADEAGIVLPAFTVPENLPVGMYRARLKIDKDNISPAGQWKEGGTEVDNQIDLNGGYVVDFLLNVHELDGKLDVQTENGSLVGEELNGLPSRVSYNEGFTVNPFPVAAGYVADRMVIRYGHHLDGEQYVHGNRQWNEYAVPVRKYTVPQEKVNGDVRLTVQYKPTEKANMVLTFSDEFNQPDGSQPDAKKWSRSPRYGATWNRFNASTEEAFKETGYIEDGKFVARCLANKYNTEKDNNGNKLDMISGALESRFKYDFTYGKVEGRILTHKHIGNFPAFWMMPTNQILGWPKDGEIDIWEQIDTEDRAYGTIHSNWANNLGQGNNPSKGGNAWAATGNYHIFGLEWTSEKLTWFVDGKQIFSYAKSKNQDHLDKGQWPFDSDFYLILNQSVGNGSWAKPCDVNHVYVTLFDWVRVYQKGKPELPETGIETPEVSSNLDYYVFGNQVRLVAAEAEWVTIHDLQGRVVYRKMVQGNEDVYLTKGIYVLNGKKIMIP